MASQIATELEDTVRRVPVIGWVALAGGAALFVFARHSHAAAALTGTPAPDNGALPGQVYPTDTGGGTSPGTTPDPGGGGVTPPPDYHQKITDIWGNTLQGFVGSLTNTPDYVNFTQGDQSITTSSGVATYGGGNGTKLTAPEEDAILLANQTQQQKNLLDYANAGWKIFQDAFTNNLAIQTQGNKDYQTAYTNNLEAFYKWLQSGGSAGGGGGGTGGSDGTAFLGPPTSGGSDTRFLGPPVTYFSGKSCGNGDTGCIISTCHSGDTACAHSVAPWWGGQPIAGW